MTRQRLSIATATIALALGCTAPAAAQRLTLTVTPSVLSFPSSDPDTVPVITSPPLTVEVRVQQNNNQPWQVTALAGGDLTAGASRIDIGAVSWTAAPAPPFRNGTLSKTVAQVVASGTGNVVPPRGTGAFIFQLANSWTYDAGTYSQVVVFTLTTP